MRWHVLAALIGAAAPAVLAQAPGVAARPFDRASFEEFVRKVEAAAELWAKDDPNLPADDSQQAGLYAKDSVGLLQQALGRLRGGNTSVFVAARLVAPLMNSDAETVRQALPAVRGLYTRLGRYRPLPTFPPAVLRALQLPDQPPAGSAEGGLKALADFVERRQKKLEAEAEVIRHNLQVSRLEQTCLRILLKARDAKEDEHVAVALARLEKEGWATYKNAVEAVQREASGMEADRAGRLYDALLELGKRLEFVDANYMDPTDLRVYTDRNSVFARPRCQPGIDILGAVNALAPVANRPVVPVPSEEEVAATTRLTNIKARLASDRSYEAARATRDLQYIVSNYPQTNAAKEARTLIESLRRPR